MNMKKCLTVCTLAAVFGSGFVTKAVSSTSQEDDIDQFLKEQGVDMSALANSVPPATEDTYVDDSNGNQASSGQTTQTSNAFVFGNKGNQKPGSSVNSRNTRPTQNPVKKSHKRFNVG